MDEPTILKFPIPSGSPSTANRPGEAPAAEEVDLQTILAAWNEATDRLQHTHEAPRSEVRRLSDEREAKNRELARKNRLADLGQMASHVAHEVRNSLVPMKLYLSLLKRRIDDDPGSASTLDKVMAGFTALEATVGDLLHFSSQRDPRRQRIDVTALLDEVLESLAPQLEAQDIRVHVDCPPGLAATADADMLRRAVLNLLLNALDVLAAGGQVVITVCKSASGLELEIADSGPGVPAPLLDRLFEPF